MKKISRKKNSGKSILKPLRWKEEEDKEISKWSKKSGHTFTSFIREATFEKIARLKKKESGD